MEKIKKDNVKKPWGEICEYDPKRDVKKVESGLAVNISDALTTGVVKDSPYLENYNGISEPSAIIGRVSDKFDAIEASRIVKKYGKKADIAPSIESSTPAPSAPAPSAPVSNVSSE